VRTFERLESEVRGYVRSFPTVFTRAKGSLLWDEEGRRYIDLFAGAGALSYGHNNEALRAPLVDYLMSDGPVHALDMATTAKRRLLETVEEVLLEPRSLQYKVQFPGPTGTNAVEAALKLARKVTGRQNVVSFTNGFHGMTLGSLAVTGNTGKRAGAGVSLGDATALPFDGYLGKEVDTVAVLERYLEDSSSGLDKPAAVILETVQAEGGVNVASVSWLRGIQALCRKHDVLLIVDDIQVGCGRTGPFFSFERAGLRPDIVCLSKSLSGYGMPFSLVLLRPELDVWSPGEHNGTFRGFNPAMVTATAALETYWRDAAFTRQTERKAEIVHRCLEALADEVGGTVRGLGLIQGLACRPGIATAIARESFARGVIIETAGPRDEVLKVLPALTIPEEELVEALSRVAEATRAVVRARRAKSVPPAPHPEA